MKSLKQIFYRQTSSPFEVSFEGDVEAFSIKVREKIATHEVCALRNIFPNPDIELQAELARKFFADVSENPDDSNKSIPRSYLFNKLNQATSIQTLSDYGSGQYDIIKMVASSPVAGVIKHLIDPPVMASILHSRLRRVLPMNNAPTGENLVPSTVDWHSDGGEGVEYYGCCILWIPLPNLSDEVPGVEFASMDKKDTGNPQTVFLNLGDAFLFTDNSPHRTVLYPASRQQRISVDMRFFSAAGDANSVSPKFRQSPALCFASFE